MSARTHIFILVLFFDELAILNITVGNNLHLVISVTVELFGVNGLLIDGSVNMGGWHNAILLKFIVELLG